MSTRKKALESIRIGEKYRARMKEEIVLQKGRCKLGRDGRVWESLRSGKRKTIV